MFGYMNQNWLEEPDVPIGPDNYFAFTSPGALDDVEVHAYDAATADMGQPTHFLPRRNRFTFKVRIPGDIGDRELVWTLRTQGTTRRAYATMRQDLLVDNMVIASETGSLGAGSSSPEVRANVGPMIELETDRVIEARVGQPVTLIARITDDGLPASARGGGRQAAAAAGAAAAEATAGGQTTAAPAAGPPETATATAGPGTPAADEPDEEAEEEEELSPELRALQRAFNEPSRITVNKVNGLHFTWFVYRGENRALFEPAQIKPWEDSRAWMNSPWAPSWQAPPIPEDNRWIVDVTFDEPGTYILHGRADDGSLYADEEITVNVTPLVN
jgi:hypothetical protein